MTRSSLLRRTLACILTVAVLAGCDLVGDDETETTVTSGVVIANSGSSQTPDGSLTIFNPSDTTASLNDINVEFINGIAVRNERLYVVENIFNTNDGRIVVYDAETFSPIDAIRNPRPPRSIAFASDDKAYVTNLSRFNPDFSPRPSTVSILDLRANAFVDTLAVGRSPEGLAIAAGKAFVANSGGTTLSVIDVASDAVTGTIDLQCTGPNEVFVDEQGEVVVVCEGGGSTNGEVLFLNPETEAIRTRVELSASVGSSNFTQSADYAPRAEELHVISGNTFFGSGTGEIFRINTAQNALETSFPVPANEALTTMSAVGYDAVRRELYVTRLPVGDDGGPSFTAQGEAVVLDRRGQLIGQFGVGVSPAHVDFLRDTR